MRFVCSCEAREIPGRRGEFTPSRRIILTVTTVERLGVERFEQPRGPDKCHRLSDLSSGAREPGHGKHILFSLSWAITVTPSHLSSFQSLSREIMVSSNFFQRGYLIAPQNLFLFQVYINTPVEAQNIISVFSCARPISFHL